MGRFPSWKEPEGKQPIKKRGIKGFLAEDPFSKGGSFLTCSWSFFCLQLSFLAYSPLRPLIDALSHCKQKSSNCKPKKAKLVSKKAPIVSKKAKIVNWNKKSFTVSRKLPTVSKKAASFFPHYCPIHKKITGQNSYTLNSGGHEWWHLFHKGTKRMF